jgi:polyphosphate:AMP phosphotransferase
MFESVELGQTVSKQEFKAKESEIRAQLLQLQRELRDANIATLIIVAGVEAAGKGDVVNRLNKWFDSRGLQTHAFWDETAEEQERPDAWRFWRRMPARGSIGIMFGGPYWEPILERAQRKIDDAELDEIGRAINEHERMLALDGMLIIKLWFHLSKETHAKRMKKRHQLQKQIKGLPAEGSDVEIYDDYLYAAERCIRLTDSGECPWHLIESDDKRYRDISVARVLTTMMHQRMEEHRVSDRRAQTHEMTIPAVNHPATILDHVDLTKSLSREEYKDSLIHYKAKLHELSWDAYAAKNSTMIVFEGWDAAGKGGTIQRMTSAIDARLFRSISVAAPTDEEQAHHYLWRFWRKVPRAGYMTIYDRSWYGRVLVERVEGFAEHYEWMRAYQEINTFEEQLVNRGMVLIKFWLHISPEEQLRRFKEREELTWKQYKITEEDWRNREKWDEYKHAVKDMIEHTSTGLAPWTLVPANDKLFARIEVLKTVCAALESTLSGN